MLISRASSVKSAATHWKVNNSCRDVPCSGSPDGSLGDESSGSPESPFIWTRPYVLPRLLGTYIPEKLIGLEQQLKTVKLHILGTARHGISSTLLIRGSVGRERLN